MESFSQKLGLQFPSLFLWYAVIVSISLKTGLAMSPPQNESVPALIVFGDSIMDTGNNNYINTLIKCNFPPYGRDFDGGNHPTGRFSNGLVPSDIVADKFGVKELLPPYLDPNLQLEDLLTGVSFASGGTGYDPFTALSASVISLSRQLDMFREYKKKITAGVGAKRAATIISKSIYLLCVGTNDLANTYFQTPFRRIQYDVPSYTDLMAEHAANFLQELHGLGARRIGVFNLPTVACVPEERTLFGGSERACSDDINKAAILFNAKLYSVVDDLARKFTDARLVYLEIYYPFLAIIQNPAKYGFDVASKGCCGTGYFEVSILCNPFSINTCTNTSQYMFFDSYHPTEKAYRILVDLVFDNNWRDFF